MKLKELSLDTLQEQYAFYFFKAYRVFPKAKNLEINRKYLEAKIEYLRKQKVPLT